MENPDRATAENQLDCTIRYRVSLTENKMPDSGKVFLKVVLSWVKYVQS